MVIEARDLHCFYGRFEAVRGVDLHIRRGELYALLGTNGAGKTTTLETLEGHRRPTSGTVRVLGGEPRSAAVRRRMGIMLQESGFAADLTVAETLRLWGKVAARRDHDIDLLEQVDLAGRRDVRVAQLSGGERRRLDLAMAVYGRPELLFLDEPTTGLDPEARARIWELVRGLLSDGATVVLTTHYLQEAETLADRLGIMHEGRIAVTGSVPELLGRYPARIAFDVPDGLTATDLPLPIDVARGHDQHVRIPTEDMQRDLWLLLAWARDRDVYLDRLSATEATLEDVFRAVARGDEAAA